MTLADFLLARIAEEEAATPRVVVIPGDTSEIAAFWHRFLLGCEARRQIVKQSISLTGVDVTDDWPLYLLALPYADHEDYREEWKP